MLMSESPSGFGRYKVQAFTKCNEGFCGVFAGVTEAVFLTKHVIGVQALISVGATGVNVAPQGLNIAPALIAVTPGSVAVNPQGGTISPVGLSVTAPAGPAVPGDPKLNEGRHLLQESATEQVRQALSFSPCDAANAHPQWQTPLQGRKHSPEPVISASCAFSQLRYAVACPCSQHRERCQCVCQQSYNIEFMWPQKDGPPRSGVGM